MNGADLRKLRERMQLSQKAFGRMLGLSRRTIARREAEPDEEIPRVEEIAARSVEAMYLTRREDGEGE